MKKIFLILSLVFAAHWLSGQIVTNTPFQINSSNPIDTRMTIATLADTSTISFPFEGLLVHVNDADSYYKYDGFIWGIFDTEAGGSPTTKSDNTGGGETLYFENSTPTANEIDDIISGALSPYQDNTAQSGLVTVPTGNPITLPWEVWKKGDGTHGTEVDGLADWDAEYWLGGKTYYIDSNAGNDANDGLTVDTPLETFAAAIAKGDGDVFMVTGIHAGVSTFNTGRTNQSIIGYGGGAIIGSIAAQQTWTNEATQGVYSVALADADFWPIDLLNKGSMSEYMRLRFVATTGELANNPGSYTYVGTTLHVHCSDGREPNTYANMLLVDNNANSISSTNFYMRNIESYGGWSFVTASQQPRIRDCGIFYSVTNDLLTFDASDPVMMDVRLGHANTDAIDYDNDAIGIEVRVVGKYAGYDVSGAQNQISTAHGGADVLTIDCDFSLASNESILDVNTGTTRWILGGRFGGDWNREDPTSYAIGTGNQSANTATMWVDGADIGTNSADDYYAEYGTIYIRGLKNFNETINVRLANGGTIEKY